MIAPVSHTLIAQVTYTPGPAPADWPFTFDEGVLRFTAPHCTGAIDARRLAAQVAITAPHPFEPIDYCVRAALALLAFEAGGLLFHAAGLARRGHGYGFFGYSGSGKTTVARVSTDAIILNDDLVVLLPQADRSVAGRHAVFQSHAGDAGRSAVRAAGRALSADSRSRGLRGTDRSGNGHRRSDRQQPRRQRRSRSGLGPARPR